MTNATHPARPSIYGRPRQITDAQIQLILDWYRTRDTRKQLRRLNLME